MLEWEWRSDVNTLALFINLLLLATHKPVRFRGIDLAPGQIIAGRIKLAQITGLSQKSVRTCLDHLKSTNEVAIRSTSKFSIITIVKWSEYQDTGQQSGQQRASKGPATGHIQEGKNERKDTPAPPGGVTDDTWAAFLAHRRVKKAPVTDLVIKQITKEANSVNWPIEDALIETITRNWQSFKAEWVPARKANSQLQIDPETLNFLRK